MKVKRSGGLRECGSPVPSVNCRAKLRPVVMLTTRPVEPRTRVEVMTSGYYQRILSSGSQILRTAFQILIVLYLKSVSGEEDSSG